MSDANNHSKSGAKTGLVLDNIRKEWLHLTLEASFQVQSSERVAIVGRSGAGKTTLLRVLAGLEKVDHGKLYLDGQEITHLPPQERQIGYLFQDQALFSAMNVIENVAFGLKVRGMERAEREAKAESWLKRIGLADRAKNSVDRLSGGEKQRVALARALIIAPRLLLLDEPFTGLDAVLKKDLISQLLELHQEAPVPLLMVSHDESDLSALATGVIRFADGATGKEVNPKTIRTLKRSY
jgi:ABC-type sulfate/molybdate transport systems ATPase subunit